MKILLFGKNSKNIEELVKGLNFEIVSKNPDLILTYGGDGTLLSSEREYPRIPKLPLRESQFCNKCVAHRDEVMLKNLLDDKLKLKEYNKLETTILYKNFYALNDFVIRNFSPIHAIRFEVNGQFFIGDGIAVSTPFGSSGYFKSITGQAFEKGYGVAFNNTTEKVDPLFLTDNTPVKFSLKRGKAILSFDNSVDIFTIDEGSELIFKLSDQVAKIYQDTSLRCPNCEVIRS